MIFFVGIFKMVKTRTLDKISESFQETVWNYIDSLLTSFIIHYKTFKNHPENENKEAVRKSGIQIEVYEKP